jgi:hypothetical protein
MKELPGRALTNADLDRVFVVQVRACRYGRL